jgi:hypothetical protein
VIVDRVLEADAGLDPRWLGKRDEEVAARIRC